MSLIYFSKVLVRKRAPRETWNQLQLCFCRCYVLPRRATGALQWERWRGNNEEPQEDLDMFCQRIVNNISKYRYAKASHLNKIFDQCVSVEQLEKAEEALKSFRRGLNLPRASLPLVVARACIRLGRPDLMMCFTRDKVKYGVFPSRKVYNIIMDAMLKSQKPKGALSAFNQMLLDEVDPDGMSYFLATRASYYDSLQRIKTAKEQSEEEADSTPDLDLDLSHTLELCAKCASLEPKLATKGYRFITGALLCEGMTDKASDLLCKLEKERTVPKQTLFNLTFDVLLAKGNFPGAIEMLSELYNHDNQQWQGVGAPQSGLPRLQTAIEQSQDQRLKESFQECKTRLQTSLGD